MSTFVTGYIGVTMQLSAIMHPYVSNVIGVFELKRLLEFSFSSKVNRNILRIITATFSHCLVATSSFIDTITSLFSKGVTLQNTGIHENCNPQAINDLAIF